MCLTFYSANNLDGSQNRNWLKFGTVQGYYHIMELLVKTAHAVFAVKSFHIYDISILISVHANCIDSIYADLGNTWKGDPGSISSQD